MNEQRDSELDAIRLERLDKIIKLTAQRDSLLTALKRITTLVRRCKLSKPNLDEPIEGKYLVIIQDCEAVIAAAEQSK